MRVTTLLAITMLWATVALVACGGGNADEGKLNSLRKDAEFAFSGAERETLLTQAFAIASRNAGKPLGQEAFSFAEETFLGWYDSAESGLFVDLVPAPGTDLDDPYLDSFRRLAGFVDASPAPYKPAAVLDALHQRLNERADFYLFRLEQSLDNRRQWAADLLRSGSTERGFQGQQQESDFANYAASLRYLRDIAVRTAEPSAFLAAWDGLIGAVVVGDYAPSSLGTQYKDGKLVTTYTAEAVAAGAQNAEQLAVAIAAVRADFPATEDETP